MIHSENSSGFTNAMNIFISILKPILSLQFIDYVIETYVLINNKPVFHECRVSIL